LSPHHPDVIATRVSFATALLETGAQQRAYDMLQDLVKQSDSHLGREHPVSIGARCALISCLCNMGQLSKAQAAWDELIEIPAAYTTPFTFMCAVGIAQGLGGRQDTAAAQSLLLKMIPLAEAHLGRENMTVVTAKMGLAMNAVALGQLPEAAQWGEQVLAANDRTLGNHHPNTTSAAWSLFLVRWRMGQYKECYQIFQERFLWFCKQDFETLDPTQREIFSLIRNTPWLPISPP
jgi:hypothetical protein